MYRCWNSHRLVRIAVFILFVGAWSPAFAQPSKVLDKNEKTQSVTPVNIPQNLTPAQVDALIAKLSDAQVRQVLLDRLRLVAAQHERDRSDAGVWNRFETQAVKIRDRLPTMVAGLAEIPNVLDRAIARLGGDKGGFQIVLLILAAVAALLVGLAVDTVYRRATARFRERTMAAEEPLTFAIKLGNALMRALVDLSSVAVFAIAAAGTFILFFADNDTARLFFRTFVFAIIIVRLISIVSRFILAPSAPALRFESLSDAAAADIHASIICIASAWFFGLAIVSVLQAWGLSNGPLTLINIVIGLVIVAIIVWVLWNSRGRVADTEPDAARLGRAATNLLQQQLAHNWHWLAILYVLSIYIIWGVSVLTNAPVIADAGLISLLLVPLVVYLDRAAGRVLAARARRAMEREAEDVLASQSGFEVIVPPPDGEPEATTAEAEAAAPQETQPGDSTAGPTVAESLGVPEDVPATGYYRLAHRIVRFLLIIIALLVFFRVWGVDLFAGAKGAIGAQVANALTDTIGIVLVAYVIWQLVRIWIDRKIAAEEADVPDQAQEEGGEGGGAPRSRMATILPLFRLFLLATLVVMTTMVVLSELGVDIGPLIAGAGVIGLAIGFGAQTLVRDIVSGVFFLVDDAFRLGEYVEMGDQRGTVEKISIRSLRLRHHRGLIHTVPYGEIKSITNYSRDWVIMKLEFRLPYGTDIEMVRKMIKKTGQEMMDDPIIAAGMLAPLKSQGVMRMEDSAMIFRAKFTAKPGEQFVIRREAYNRIHRVLSEAGIHFAHSQVTVNVTEPEKKTTRRRSAQSKAAGAAGAAAAARKRSTGSRGAKA